ncbi:uncharacterized protein LOC126904125 isoform X2 [Daktulosphaira vitifoliae]|uniref:uncharacterized protein LOC126904125 isoform X1 n=1 Tax=Daktulosphaira vitifoliae TaxID=58002 RepID=UPI0021AAA361|nr:uncharacterized protein LOC126904125 isoform X1 [Daktulosphaira vitifoliae]XP_050538814.1 uncharacterized protein LOC126904125 isoform X2 [Daktulosphaira vitifoliae]
MTTESNDQPLRSAGLLYTISSAQNRCSCNSLSCNHGVVAQSAAAASMNQEPNNYCNLSEYNQIASTEFNKLNNVSSSTVVAKISSSIVSTPAAYVSSITVPSGWKRISNSGEICYISPSNTVLNSLDQVKTYLKTQGTCKCGLECPLHSEQVFNFDVTVLAKPTSDLDIMTNLCNHKRKMMFNNVDNRFGKSSYELADNRKKRKMSSIQQQFSYPSYDGDNTIEKENYLHSMGSQQMQWPDVCAETINQVKFHPSTSDSLLHSQMHPIMTQNSPTLMNSQGTVRSTSQTMMPNSQGTTPSSNQELPMLNIQGVDIENSRHSHYPNNYYNLEVDYDQTNRNGLRYNSPPNRSHDMDTIQPNLSCQTNHHQFNCDTNSQEFYHKNNMYQHEQMQYSNYDSQRIQKSFNCSSHCEQYCNPGEPNPSYDNQMNPFQQTSQPQLPRNHGSTNHQYFQQMYQDQNNYQTESYPDNNNGQRDEFTSHYQFESNTPSQCHHIDCNCKTCIPNKNTVEKPIETSQIKPLVPQLKSAQSQNDYQNTQTTMKPSITSQNKSTPPWQLNKYNQTTQVVTQDTSKKLVEERVPPINSQTPHINVRAEDRIRKPIKQLNKQPIYSKKPKSPSEENIYPSFLDDPSGYLAQQTALLNSTISTNSFSPLSPPIQLQKPEKPRFTTNVTTMASGKTASCNTVTSVLAGRTNTSVVTVNTSEEQAIPVGQQNVPNKTPLEMVQSVVSSIQIPPTSEKQDNVQPSHILFTSNGQLMMASTKIQSPNTSQVLSAVQQQVQPTVLVNTLQGTQGTLLLQPGNVMTVDQVQVPQLTVTTGNVDTGSFSPRSSNLLSSPDCKRKINNVKKRKSPQISPNQSNSNVMLHSPQQNYHQPVVQTLILPNKTTQYSNQQLITNVLQPVSLVHNVPAIQQFIVPTNLGGVVMTDNTILQDGVHLNVLTPFANTGQNILPTGMVLRTAQTQQRHQQNNQFIVNSVGQLSPILTANLNQTQHQSQNRSQQQNEIIHVVPCSVQQSQDNTTVVQQNTTIVQQQMTMVSGQQSNEQSNLLINEKQGQNFILADNKQHGFILSPKDKQHTGTHYILNNVNSEKKTQSFIITSPTSSEKQLCGNFILEKSNSSGNFIITTTTPDKSSKFSKHSVSTQTAAGQQVLQISPTSTLLVATNRNSYVGSPPDTTTLSPVSGHSPPTKVEMPSSSVTADLDAALSPSSTFSDIHNRQPMVHCISSSNVVDWSDNSTDERKTVSSASGSPNMYSVEHAYPR